MARIERHNVSARTVGDILSRTMRPCITCGEPVMWMAQHRECWRWEMTEAAKAGTTVEKLFCWAIYRDRRPMHPRKKQLEAA